MLGVLRANEPRPAASRFFDLRGEELEREMPCWSNHSSGGHAELREKEEPANE
jgi:hypothetical protein